MPSGTVPSTEAFVTLERVDQDVVLRVVDAGCGFDPVAKRQAAGLGLVSMRERVRAVGGTLTVTSSPGHGTSIEARVRHATAVESRRSPISPPRRSQHRRMFSPGLQSSELSVDAPAAYPGWVAHRHRDDALVCWLL